MSFTSTAVLLFIYKIKNMKNCNSLRKVCLFPLQFRASLPGIVAGIVTKPEFRGLPKKWIDWRSGPHPEAAQPEVAEGHRLDLLPKGDLLSGEVLDRVHNLNVFIHSFLSKVQIFWEGQNNLKKSPNLFWSYELCTYLVSLKNLEDLFMWLSQNILYHLSLLIESNNQFRK